MMIVVTEMIEEFKWYQNIPTVLDFDFKYYLMRTAYVALTGYLAISIPKIGIFMNFIGSLTCTSITFVFPVLIYEKAFEGEINLRDKIINKVIIIVGLIGGSIASVLSLIALIQAF